MLPLAPELRDVLLLLLEKTRQLEKTTERVIPWMFHRNGKPIRDYHGAWDEACRLAGLPDRIAHDLRRMAVRNLERAGVPRSASMEMVGHKTESIYRRNSIVNAKVLEQAAVKLAALQANETAEIATPMGIPLTQRTTQ